jgi:hypothetical protein
VCRHIESRCNRYSPAIHKETLVVIQNVLLYASCCYFINIQIRGGLCSGNRRSDPHANR